MYKKRTKRKLDDEDLPLCKYGFLCYQKNPTHLKKFRHPVPNSDLVEKTGLSEAVDASNFIEKRDSSVKASPVKNEEDSKENTTDNKTNDLPSVNLASSHPNCIETVQEILDSMPQDFFDFWDFCCSLNKKKPEDAFAELGFHLVGTYDLLSKKLPKDKKVLLHCHYRYYYDPPEFQTVIKLNDKDKYHIGYFRDDPTRKPSILATNSAGIGPKLTLAGDNIFAAMNEELSKRIKDLKSKQQTKFKSILEKLKVLAEEKKFSLKIISDKCKARNKKVVSKTFHGLGIVVPVVNDVGYRPLPDSDATLKNILKKIVNADTESKRLDMEESLDEIMTNIQFANDECDFGMGLELGIDLFCYGDSYFHSHILNILPLAYILLKRPKYAEIVKLHLANRSKDELITLED